MKQPILIVLLLTGWTMAQVHHIDLPRYAADLPDATGREEFAVSCGACHTAAYVTMQPKLSAIKWEEEVRKMQKVYGAPIAEDQVKPVVQYLMTVKEGDGPQIHVSPVAASPAAPEILPPADDATKTKDLEKGAAVFMQNCANCHGPDGKGNGPAGLTLLPRPEDLSAAKYSFRIVAASVNHGVSGTAMPAFAGKLPPDDLRAVVSFVTSLCQDDEKPPAFSGDTEKLFQQACASCHGLHGAADGLASPTLPRPAADFTGKRPGTELAAKSISDGIPGTPMPAWKGKLTPEQCTGLAAYVRTLYQAQ